ncbi:MAG: hypothetical protein P8168_14325 [Deltaproteobacteria bacterium]
MARMNFHLEYYWLGLALGALLVLWGVSLLAMRFITRHQVIQTLLRQDVVSEELSITLPDPRPEDQAALELIRSYRRRYLMKWWPVTAISFKAINDMSMELIKEIAKAYYPGEVRPELKASLANLVALHNRVGTRLAAWLETRPIRAFKDVELGTLVRYHEMYRNIKGHWGLAFIKRHHLDQLVRWGWTAFNFANPWHWGRKAAYHGGKEAASRLLMARVIDLVGEEAMRIYGRQPASDPKKSARSLPVTEVSGIFPARPH